MGEHERPRHGTHRDHGPERSLAEISVTVWLTPENSEFYLKNGFLYAKIGEKENRVSLCRDFPFEMLWEFISVMDENRLEIGLIRSLDDFTGETKELLRTELERRYYAPKIDRIDRVKDKYGFSYWKVQTPEGEMQFTMHDTYRNIIHISEERVILMDVSGNRFEIPDLNQLDRKSYKKIEIYL